MDMNVIRMCVGVSSVLGELLIWNTLQQKKNTTTTTKNNKSNYDEIPLPGQNLPSPNFLKFRVFLLRGKLTHPVALFPGRLLGRRRKKEDMGVGSARREEEYEQYLLIGHKIKSVSDRDYISSFHKQFLCVRDQHFSYTKIMHHTDN